MGKRGPPPTPTEILEARGSWRAKKRHKEAAAAASAAVSPERETPRRPAWLTPAAVKVWNELTPILKGMGVLTIADGATISRYCQSLVDWVKYDAAIRKEGAWYETPHGQKCAHPAVRLRAECAKILKESEDRLGLSPSARSSLNVTIAWIPGNKAPQPVSGDPLPTQPPAPIDGERFFKRT